MINISELIEDPDFKQPNGIIVKRSTITYENFRPVKTTTTITLQGIITINNQNIDALEQNGDRNTEGINIFTYDRLYPVGIDKASGIEYGADIVHFNNEDYIVRECLDDSQYGFCRSTAYKINPEDM